jgi:hypothetical protein
MEKHHREKISEIAFQLFRAWTKNATKYYPTLDFTIIDESEIVDDLKTVVLEGIAALGNDDNKEKSKRKGFEYAYLMNFVRVHLDSLWKHEYIHKNTECFKNYAACSAILGYLGIATEAGIHINFLYSEAIKMGTNLADIRTEINEVVIKKYDFNIPGKGRCSNENQNPIIVYLENQLSKHFVEFMESAKVGIMPYVYSYFSEEFVTELILTYE